jgi:hypothetical protein
MNESNLLANSQKNVLFRIVGGVSENSRKNPPHYSISTLQNNTMAICRKEIIIQ